MVTARPENSARISDLDPARAHVRGIPTAEDPAVADRPLTLPGLLDEAAARIPDIPAVITPNERITYRQLLESARRVATHLSHAGIRPGDRVAVLAPNSPDFAIALFGIALSGGIAALVNGMGSRADIEAMLHTAGCRYILAVPSGREGQDSDRLISDLLRSRATTGDRIAYVADILRRLPPGGPVPAVTASPDDDAVVIFTSGTTGQAKGVLHCHRAVAIQSLHWAAVHGLTRGEKVFSTAPMFWSSGLTKSFGSALAAGASLVTMQHFDPGQALSLLAGERVTTVILPPHLDRRIIDHPGFRDADLAAVRRVHRRNEMRRRLGLTEEWNPGGYGLSEMCTSVASYPASLSLTDLDGSCGTVLSGAEIRIADVETGRTLGRGESGRIWVGGETLMRGYLNADARFDDYGLFATSDLGHIDADSRVYFDGRLDSVVKSAGVNVSPLEVENAITGYSRVTASAVVTLPHPTLGAALVLCATPADEALTEADLAEFLRSRLARYKLPRRILFLPDSELPRTVTQKIDLPRMREIAARRLLPDVDSEWVSVLTEAFPVLAADPGRGASAAGEDPSEGGTR